MTADEFVEGLGSPGVRTGERARLARALREGDLPLSFAQQRLWFLDQLAPDTSAYTIAARRRFHGPLDQTALANALTELVRRHESLRTTFPNQDGEPVQRISDPAPVTLDTVNLEHMPQGERASAALRVTWETIQRPFDLAHDPLFRSVLIRLGPEEHELIVIIHHIVADGWSLGILARELTTLYEAGRAGLVASLPELPIQYADYALWQRQWVAGELFEGQRRYWHKKLAGRPAPLELPTDHARSRRLTVAGAAHDFALPGPLAARLRLLSRNEQTTLFMTLLAAFKALLARYSDQEDVLVGTPVANRNHIELESVIGFFANTLILRTSLKGNPTFRELLARVREACLGAYAHPDMPFEKLVEELQPERILGQNPLFQVTFVLQDAATSGDFEFVTVASPFDLSFFVREGRDGTLSATIQYKRDLFKPDTIARLAGHYRTLLEGAVADPDQRLSALPLLTEAERHLLLKEWNSTQRPFPRSACISALFEAQVERTPEAVAATFEDQSLTYRQLNQRANQLAHHLRRHGVCPEAAVGICLKPSLDLIVGLLGILKAGGAYVPLDPTYPRERLAFMLEDARAMALVTHQGLIQLLPAVHIPVISLDADPHVNESTATPAHETTGEHVAYLMYTSGSTGQPKAVAVPHRGITRLVLNTDYVTITPSDVMAHVSNASFDAATFEIWGALLNGARLAIIPREVVLSPAELSAELDRHRVTILLLTTALFNQTAREKPSAFRQLRTVLFGGETAEPRSVAEVLRHGAPERLLNLYGPTEATTIASWYRVTSVSEGTTSIPIGRPIGNTQIYLLDRHRNPVPIGVPGELYIGGPGVALGYLHRPELTADAFVPDPFSAEPEGRLYKTGDLASYLADGNIEFLGRKDDQVKIRGNRIEPAEIESVLRQHPQVRESVVVTREDAPGDKRLVAYLVAAKQPATAIGDLRVFLKERLPSYMIPAQFVTLEALPLTPNGKIDRRKLPAPRDAQPERDAGYVPPESPLEEQLVQIWEEFLDVRPIGVRDDFFDLGGHSLLAVQVMSAIERTVGRRLPLSTLFAGATIQRLAEVLLAQEADTLGSPVTAIHAEGTRVPFFFLHGDYNGGGFYCLNLARVLGAEQPFYVLHPHGLDGRPVPASIEALASEHLATVRTVQPHGPYLLGGHCNGGLIAFEMAQRLTAQGERVEFLALLDTPAENTWLGAGLLRGLVDWSGKIRGRTEQERLERFIRLQRRIVAGREWAGYYRRRVREVLRYPVNERVATLRRQARRSSEALVRIFRPRPAFPAASTRSPEPTGPTRARPGSPDEAYGRAMAGYIPRRYDGRIALFNAHGDSSEPTDLGWRAVAREVEVHVIPGDHLTFITRHVRVLGEHLSACLQKVDLT